MKMALKMRKKTCLNCKHYEPPEYIETSKKHNPNIGGFCTIFSSWISTRYHNIKTEPACTNGYKRK